MYECQGLNQLAKEISIWRERKGFVTSWENMYAKLMLIVTELSEATKEYEANRRGGFEIEIADAIIRLLDIMGTLEIDIEKVIKGKMIFNEKRHYAHGKVSGDVRIGGD